MSNYAYSGKPDLKSHAEIARKAGTEGIILLENKNETLPLSSAIQSVAPFGIASFNHIAGGTGSGNVNKAYTISLTDALMNVGYRLDEDLLTTYEDYVIKEKNRIEEGYKTNPFMPISYVEMELDKEIIKQKAQSTDITIVTIGRSSGEFADRKNSEGDYLLSKIEMDLVKNVTEAFHAANKKVVVVLNIGGVIETESWKNLPDAILLAWQLGQEGGNPILDVLKGKVSPSGKLTMTFPVNYVDIPSAKNFPGTPLDDPLYVNYEEGIYVGYRYFTTFNIKPSYEFGYGLSYTTFTTHNVKIDPQNSKGETVTLSMEVQNTGKRKGKEVVQLYISAPKGKIDKPIRELKAFAKTKTLAPGEVQTLKFTLTPKDLASFYEDRSAWITDKGIYTLEIGFSSQNIIQKVNLNLASEIEVEKVNDILR